MKKILSIIIAIAFVVPAAGALTFAATASPSVVQSGSPRAVVVDLYKQHDSQKSPFFQTENRPLVDKFFTKALADLIWKDATSSSGEVGALDGDPLYNAQDLQVKNFKIGSAVIKGKTATVPVTFSNMGRKNKLTFSLSRVGDGWKISNISYGGSESLMKWLKAEYP
jgi:hypothetical protein